MFQLCPFNSVFHVMSCKATPFCNRILPTGINLKGVYWIQLQCSSFCCYV